MTTIRIPSRVASFVSAIMLVLPMSPAMAQGGRDNNAPVDISFTKWVTAFPRMEGVTGGAVDGVFVGEILQRQVSVNPNLNGIIRYFGAVSDTVGPFQTHAEPDELLVAIRRGPIPAGAVGAYKKLEQPAIS